MPKGEAVCIEDIAWGIAGKFRYGGHTNPRITVAEHCLLVASIVENLWPESGLVLAALLHDSCESYTHDIQSPVRKSIFVELPNGDRIPWDEMDKRILNVVARTFDLPPESFHAPEVKASDCLAATFEKRDTRNLGDDDWGLPEIPPAVEHLKHEFLSPKAAHDAFLVRFSALIAAR